MQKYQKNLNAKLSEHLSSNQFDCHCKYEDCKETLIEEDLIEALETLWELSGGFHIDSGFRCQKHNADIGGVDDSQHTLGSAADCKSIKGYNGHLMARYAEQIPAFMNGGIGIYPSFAHCDVRKKRARWGHPIPC